MRRRSGSLRQREGPESPGGGGIGFRISLFLVEAIMLDKDYEVSDPRIGDYSELEKILPRDYYPLLRRKDTQRAIFAAKSFIEDHLCEALHLTMVTAPMELEAESATRWKRMALKRFGAEPGEGICTHMRAVRKAGFVDYDHIADLDRWDWEAAIRPEERGLDFLKGVVNRVWKTVVDAQDHLQYLFPELKAPKYADLPRKLTFFHAEDILEMYQDLAPEHRETAILQEYKAIFVIGSGWMLRDGYPHQARAADEDNWCTVTGSIDGRPRHGLNGYLLVWNPVTRARHEMASMGIRADAESLKMQAQLTGHADSVRSPYHKAILDGTIPLSMGGWIGQSRTLMVLLRKAHLGEVIVSAWPKTLKEICARRNIQVLE
jgi:aspartate--ammonia ligase